MAPGSSPRSLERPQEVPPRNVRRVPLRVAHAHFVGILIALVAFVALARLAQAQALSQAVNLAALANYPTFYTDRSLAVRGHLHEAGGRLSFEDEEGHGVLATCRPQAKPDGIVEATAQLWDLGRMKQDDPRLAGYDLTPIVKASGEDWPRPGDVFVLAIERFVPVQESADATIRSIILEGPHAVGRLVTVSGQFRGRNLFGDLPRSPGNAPSDFVLRSSNAAIWVSGMAPRGKDFQLDPGSRIDTNRWLQVSGIVRETRGLMWVEAKSIALSTSTGPAADQAAPARAVVPPAPAPEVLFSVPVNGEVDVSPATTVRIQLSRDVDAASLKGNVRAGYVGPGAAQLTVPETRLEVDERNRVLTLHFAAPLERFRTFRVELTDGIKSTDGQPLKPWQLTFTVGAQ